MTGKGWRSIDGPIGRRFRPSKPNTSTGETSSQAVCAALLACGPVWKEQPPRPSLRGRFGAGNVPHWVGRKYRIANRITNDTTTIRGTLRSVIELVQKEKAPHFELSGPTPSESLIGSQC